LGNDPLGMYGLDITMVMLMCCDKDNSIFGFVSLVAEVWQVGVPVA
jgi:hypothetical protein